MTVEEAISLFKHEMINEIYHNVTDSVLQDTLVNAVEDVSVTVSDTYEAEKKSNS